MFLRKYFQTLSAPRDRALILLCQLISGSFLVSPGLEYCIAFLFFFSFLVVWNTLMCMKAFTEATKVILTNVVKYTAFVLSLLSLQR